MDGYGLCADEKWQHTQNIKVRDHRLAMMQQFLFRSLHKHGQPKNPQNRMGQSAVPEHVTKAKPALKKTVLW